MTAPAHSPEGVSVDIQGPHTVNVSWSPPSSQQNGVIRSYTVNLTTSTGLTHQYIATSTFILIQGLISYSTYFIQVAAFTVASGPYSETAYAATPETGKYSWTKIIPLVGYTIRFLLYNRFLILMHNYTVLLFKLAFLYTQLHTALH